MISIAKNGYLLPLEWGTLYKNGIGTAIPANAEMYFSGNEYTVGQTSYPAWSCIRDMNASPTEVRSFEGDYCDTSDNFNSKWVNGSFGASGIAGSPYAPNVIKLNCFFYRNKILIKHAVITGINAYARNPINHPAYGETNLLELYAATKFSLNDYFVPWFSEFALIGSVRFPCNCTNYTAEFNITNQIPCYGYQMRLTSNYSGDGYSYTGPFEAWSTDTKPTT